MFNKQLYRLWRLVTVMGWESSYRKSHNDNNGKKKKDCVAYNRKNLKIKITGLPEDHKFQSTLV